MPRAAFLSEFWRDIVSIGSLIVTIVGFGLTIAQLRKTRRAADAAREASTKAIQESRGDYFRYAVSNVDRLFAEATHFVNTRDWSQASLRLGDMTHQIAQLLSTDTDCKGILAEERTWQHSLRLLSAGGKTPFRAGRWADFSVNLQAKIDEHHSPFKTIETEGPR